MADEQKPTTIGDGDPRIENDPEVLAEERRLRIKMLRLRYYRDLAGTAKVFLQTFKTEATSLVSGLGTLVLGYYQIKKWVLHERQETKTITMTANGKASAQVQKVETNAKARVAEGSSGRLQAKKKSQPRPTPTVEVPKVEELVGVSAPLPEPTFVSDPMFYLMVICGVAFGLTSGKMMFKRFRGNKATGGSNGPL